MKLTARLQRIEPSVTLALDARAKALAASGADVINMAVGEPDFPSPRVVIDAATAKVQSGHVRYTPVGGTPSLRAAVAEHVAATRGGAWGPEHVTICHSVKHALSATLLSLVETGDEVLIPLPAWVSYFDLVRLTGAEPVLVPSPFDADGFHPDLDALRAAITPRTRMICINSPNNPSGTVWTREEIEAVTRLAIEHDLWLLTDEIYRSLVYDTEPWSPLSIPELRDEARARTLLVDGASKGLAMTGYRIGFLAGPEPIAQAVVKLASQTNGSPNDVGQAAYEAALRNPPPEVETMRLAFDERRRVLLTRLAELGLETPEPKGAFYAFPNVAAFTDERGTIGFCEELLETERLALVPGEAFGCPGHVRLSYALDLDTIERAVGRLERFFSARRAGTTAAD